MQSSTTMDRERMPVTYHQFLQEGGRCVALMKEASTCVRACLAEVRQDWEKLVYSHRWSGRARREGIFNGHVAQLGQLAEEVAAAEAAGAAGEALEEASAVLAEMEQAKREMEAVAG